MEKKNIKSALLTGGAFVAFGVILSYVYYTWGDGAVMRDRETKGTVVRVKTLAKPHPLGGKIDMHHHFLDTDGDKNTIESVAVCEGNDKQYKVGDEASVDEWKRRRSCWFDTLEKYKKEMANVRE